MWKWYNVFVLMPLVRSLFLFFSCSSFVLYCYLNTMLNIIPIEIFNFEFFVSALVLASHHFYILSTTSHFSTKWVKKKKIERAPTLTQTDHFKILFGAHFRQSMATLHFLVSAVIVLFPFSCICRNRKRFAYWIKRRMHCNFLEPSRWNAEIENIFIVSFCSI